MLTTFLGVMFVACIAGMVATNPTDDKLHKHTELKDIKGEGITVSRHVRLSVNQCNEHILMVAPSGSGKSRRFIMPNVNTLTNCSIVVTDPSGEIQKTCRHNKQEYIFNPFNTRSIGYDPLMCCRSEFEVRKIAKVILANGMSKTDNGHQQEWVDMATPLLTAYMLANYKTHKYTFDELIKNICTKNILPTKRKPEDSILHEILESGSMSAKTEFDSFMQVMGASQTLSSIRIVMNTCLQVFMDPTIKHLFHKPTFSFNKLRDEQATLYIQVPERHSEYYSPLTATLLTQMIDCLLDTTGNQIYMMLDEFTNIGKIPDMCKLLATARKHKLSIVAAIQSLTQLYRVYGEVEGKELHELFKTTLVCSGLRDSAEYISKIIGTHKVDSHLEPIMTEDEIRTMDKEDVIVICSNKKPVMDKLHPIYTGA